MAFPIARVDRMRESSEYCKGLRLTDAANLILDSGGETLIKSSAERGLAPFDVTRKPGEFNNILCNFLIILHPKVIQFGFGISSRVVGSEVSEELVDEGIPNLEIIGRSCGDKSGLEVG